MAAAARKIDPAEVPRVIIAAAPLTMSRDEALAYTGIAPSLFAAMEASGDIVGKPIGRQGAKIYRTEQLEAVVKALFGRPANDIDDEFGLDG